MTTRQRALAKVALFVLCALLFVNLACNDAPTYEHGGRNWTTGSDGLPREWK